jgi:hypothetical protein
MTVDETMRHIRENTELNQLRAKLSGIIGKHEQAGMQRHPSTPVAMRCEEFDDVLALLALAVKLGLVGDPD